MGEEGLARPVILLQQCTEGNDLNRYGAEKRPEKRPFLLSSRPKLVLKRDAE